VIIAEYACLLQDGKPIDRLDRAIQKYWDLSTKLAVETAVQEQILHARQVSTSPSPSKPSDLNAAPKLRGCCFWVWNSIWTPTSPSALDVNEKTALLGGSGRRRVIEAAPPPLEYDAAFCALIMQRVVDECHLSKCDTVVFIFTRPNSLGITGYTVEEVYATNRRTRNSDVPTLYQLANKLIPQFDMIDRLYGGGDGSESE